MTLAEMKASWTEIGTQVRAANEALAAMAMTGSPEEIEAKQSEIVTLTARMAAAKAAYETAVENEGGMIPMSESTKKINRRASSEYAEAFDYALRHGINARNGRGNERVNVLFDAMTEGGGNPVGSEGGFLVPEELDNQIHIVEREYKPLSEIFGAQTVSAPTGWGVVDTAPTAGFTNIDEMDTVPTDGQPTFVKVPYSLKKYGLRLPVSNELLRDEVCDLNGYLANWFGRKLAITMNAALLAKLPNTDATVTATDAAGIIKEALNVLLDPAVSANAKMIMNQSTFNMLDQVKDGQQRGLLQPDATNATLYRIFGREVFVVSDAQMGEAYDGKVYIGDFTKYATVYSKNGMEIASTDIGGDAWKTDSTEFRAIVRMDVAVFDTGAAVRVDIAE